MIVIMINFRNLTIFKAMDTAISELAVCFQASAIRYRPPYRPHLYHLGLVEVQKRSNYRWRGSTHTDTMPPQSIYFNSLPFSLQLDFVHRNLVILVITMMVVIINFIIVVVVVMVILTLVILVDLQMLLQRSTKITFVSNIYYFQNCLR